MSDYCSLALLTPVLPSVADGFALLFAEPAGEP
jgi:hypothetical protein